VDLPFLNTSPSPEGTDGDDATLNDLLALYQSANDVPPPFAPLIEPEVFPSAPEFEVAAADFSISQAVASPDAEIDDLIKSFQDAAPAAFEPPAFAADPFAGDSFAAPMAADLPFEAAPAPEFAAFAPAAPEFEAASDFSPAADAGFDSPAASAAPDLFAVSDPFASEMSWEDPVDLAPEPVTAFEPEPVLASEPLEPLFTTPAPEAVELRRVVPPLAADIPPQVPSAPTAVEIPPAPAAPVAPPAPIAPAAALAVSAVPSAIAPFTGDLPAVATTAERLAVNRNVLESLSEISNGIDQVQGELNGLYENLALAASHRASVGEIVSLTERLTAVKGEVGENSALYQQALQLRTVAEAYIQLLKNL